MSEMEQHSGFTPEAKLSVAVSVSAETTCPSMKAAVFSYTWMAVPIMKLVPKSSALHEVSFYCCSISYRPDRIAVFKEHFEWSFTNVNSVGNMSTPLFLIHDLNRSLIHKCISHITHDLQRLRINKCVSQLFLLFYRGRKKARKLTF